MELQREETDKAETAGPAPSGPLVVVIGEYFDTGMVVLESFLADLAKFRRPLLVLLAKRKKIFAAPDDGQLLKGYAYLSEKAAALGMALEQRFTVSRDPYADVKRDCLTIASENPGALFCFLQWGVEEGKPDVMEALRGRKLKAVSLLGLLTSRKEGVSDER